MAPFNLYTSLKRSGTRHLSENISAFCHQTFGLLSVSPFILEGEAKRNQL